MKDGHYNRLGIRSFAFAVGITSAVGIFILGILAWQFQLGEELVRMMGSVYRGYNTTLPGILIGTFWGFIEGLIAGLLIAGLYNLFIRCCSKNR